MTTYFRGTGYGEVAYCGTEETCERCADRWYPRCGAGYISKNCTLCVPVAEQKPTSTSMTHYFYYIFMALLVLVFLYHLFWAPRWTENTVPDLLFGTPGVSDPYTDLQSLSAGTDPEYYI